MPANAIRIIGGRWRGRKLRFPQAPELRPTPDRVRETLFNWLKLATSALETHCGDALSFLARDTRVYDVVFLDPPFTDASWSRLLPAAAARLSKTGRLYIEAPFTIDAPEGLTLWRRDKAGQVHYHLLRRVGD